jgi:hypothetical protein
VASARRLRPEDDRFGSRTLGEIVAFETAKCPSRGDAEYQERNRRAEQKDWYYSEIADYLKFPLQPEQGQINDPTHEPCHGNENPNPKHPPTPID